MSKPAVATILLATDLSARCDRAGDRAIALAQHWQAKLHVLTVLEPAGKLDKPPAADVTRIADARRAAEESLKGHTGAEIDVLIGPADEAIAALATRLNVDLIVTGPSGGTWMGQTILGATVRHLVRLVRAPVLLVKQRVVRGYRRVVAAMDLSDASRAPVDAAFRLFGEDASLSVFHTFSTPFRLFSNDVDAYEAGIRDGVTLEIREALQAWSVADAANLPVIAEYGDPAAKLSELVEKHDIDLAVTGTHGRTGVMKLMLGSVAEAIIATVPCDVLVAPSRGAWPG